MDDLSPSSAPSAPTPEPALRDATLAGRFFGQANAAAARRSAELPTLRPGEALRSWFGAALASQLIDDPERLRGAIDRDIAAIDRLIGDQLDAILHAPRLQTLEGRWRGLGWLLGGFEASGKIKVRLLNVTWAEICRDLERAAEFDASQLFHKIYENEFGMPGGEPFGMLIIDHEVRHRPAPGFLTDDVGALAALAGVAAAAFAPIILGASPALLDLDSFEDLAGIEDPASALLDTDHQRFRSIGGLEDSRFLALALPRFLARPPWGDNAARPEGFRYREYAPDARSRVWMNAAFAFAAVAVRAFNEYGWPADLRGVEFDQEGGGLVTHMPLEPFETDPSYVWIRHPLEFQLTDRQEQSLINLGLLPLSAMSFGPDAVFSAVPSIQVAKRYQGSNANVADLNARISSQLGSMLCVSRFAHCLKMIGRDMVGAFKTKDEIESALQTWVTKYVNGNLSAGLEMRAKYPLVAARVSVREKRGQPGVFGCAMHLQPHYQLDNVAATFRLLTDIAAPGQAS